MNIFVMPESNHLEEATPEHRGGLLNGELLEFASCETRSSRTDNINSRSDRRDIQVPTASVDEVGGFRSGYMEHRRGPRGEMPGLPAGPCRLARDIEKGTRLANTGGNPEGLQYVTQKFQHKRMYSWTTRKSTTGKSITKSGIPWVWWRGWATS